MLIPHLSSVVLGTLNWWLPQNYSAHGRQVDLLFTWIFAISMLVMVGVIAAMVAFCIKYRHNPNRRAVFTHGNTRLEMIWTVIPAIILMVIVVASNKVWSDYRYADRSRDPAHPSAKILVIGEQFKWNIIYPGPDGKFGKYLLFPKPTDAKWPGGETFQGFAGPRDVPPDKVESAIKQFIAASEFARLGKDMDDPDGKDDLWQGALGRAVEVPFDRPVDVSISSKDVIHSFSLPNFRVKLDTVPGLRGTISFTVDNPAALTSAREKQTRRKLPLDQITELMKNPATSELYAYIDETSAGADQDATGWRYSTVNPRRKTQKVSIIRTGGPLLYMPDNPARDTIAQLKAIGVTELTVYRPGYFDIACQELCGAGHYTMQGQLKVIPNAEYAAKYESLATTNH